MTKKQKFILAAVLVSALLAFLIPAVRALKIRLETDAASAVQPEQEQEQEDSGESSAVYAYTDDGQDAAAAVAKLQSAYKDLSDPDAISRNAGKIAAYLADSDSDWQAVWSAGDGGLSFTAVQGFDENGKIVYIFEGAYADGTPVMAVTADWSPDGKCFSNFDSASFVPDSWTGEQTDYQAVSDALGASGFAPSGQEELDSLNAARQALKEASGE